MDILQAQSQLGNLFNLPSLANSELSPYEKRIAEFIQQLLDVDQNIDNVFKEFNPKAKIQSIDLFDFMIQLKSYFYSITLIMYDYILNILQKNRDFIEKINPLVLQKLQLLNRISSNFELMEKLIKGQLLNTPSAQLQQKLKSVQKQKQKYQNLRKQFQIYFQQINFQFKNDELESQIQNFKNNTYQYQRNKQILKNQISLLKQQLQHEQFKAEQLENELNKFKSQNNEQLKRINTYDKMKKLNYKLKEKLSQAEFNISTLQKQGLQDYQIKIHQGNLEQNNQNRHTILDNDENQLILKFNLDVFKDRQLILALYIHKLFKGDSFIGLVDKKDSKDYFNFFGKNRNQQISNDFPVFFQDFSPLKITSNIISTKKIFQSFQEECCVLIFDSIRKFLIIYKNDGEILQYQVIMPQNGIEYIPCIIMNRNNQFDDGKDQSALIKFDFINVQV